MKSFYIKVLLVLIIPHLYFRQYLILLPMLRTKKSKENIKKYFLYLCDYLTGLYHPLGSPCSGMTLVGP